jgi:hypothetical protein
MQMVRVITAGETARVVLDGPTSSPEDVNDLVAGIRRCADDGVEELLITVLELDHGWLNVIEEGLAGAPDPLRIWLAVGDPEAVRV